MTATALVLGVTAPSSRPTISSTDASAGESYNRTWLTVEPVRADRSRSASGVE
ncbi:MAG TPA: hypothetical protein VFG96_00290 [Jiangellaceae bacterium]|nr:hypothetical protein [Jiangellaceae bacterium]